MNQLALTTNVAFLLACDVERAIQNPSGFKPALTDLGGERKLFGDLRVEGAAAMLRIGFAQKVIVVGGDEGRYRDETPTVNRAAAIAKMLVEDHDINADRVSHIGSRSNTDGNIAAMKQTISELGLDPEQYAVISNLYHLVRAGFDLRTAGLLCPQIPAEAFLLLAGDCTEDEIAERLDGGELAARVAREIMGYADKIRGTYRSRTDNVPKASNT